MNEIAELDGLDGFLSLIFSTDILKLVVSNNSGELPFIKIEITKKSSFYQVEKRTEKQAFHEKVEPESLNGYCLDLIEKGYRQLNAWNEFEELSLKVSKKGKLLFTRQKKAQAPNISLSHNREKQYLLEEGLIIAPLVDMGIFTKEGKIVRSMQDKYRQINKFVEIIDEAIEKSGLKKINIIDFGCGKSYLTFILYYYLVFIKKIEIEMIGLDLKADVIEKCNNAAKKYGYSHLSFEVGDINGYKPSMDIDLVISLHACDVATDFALFNAICWNSKMIISVPCCQHELCGQLESETLKIFERYGIIRERSAALMTDTIRGNLLEYCGYKTQLLEFIDFEHTPKNLLIRAVKANITTKHKKQMLDEVNALCDCFSLKPTLLTLLKDNIQQLE